MSEKSLKQKAASGMLWTALQRYSTMFIQFVSGIILARLLTPYDYGCIGMLMIFMVLAESFIDGGFGSALIQKKNPTPEDYSTIFFWNLGMAVVLYAILYFVAPLIALFYDIPLLCPVLRVQGIILFIYAFNIVQRNQLQKSLNFKVLSTVTIATSVISLSVTILMAYHGFGVWSLVAQNILFAVIPALVFWFHIRWRPILVFSTDSFKSLFSFGSYMFLTQLTNQLSHQLRGLFIGKLYSAEIMGYYSKAQNTEKMASHSISQIMNQVTYPLYAKVQDDREQMQRMIRRLTTTVAFLTFPLMFILILIAKPLFILLYSEKWIESVPYFQIICLAGLGGCLQSVNLQTISAIGKSKVMFVWALVKQGVGLVLIIGGLLLFGMYGLLWGSVVNSWLCTFINMSLVSKHIGLSFFSQLHDLLPIAFVSVIAFGAGFLTNRQCFFDMYGNGFISVLVFIIIYCGWIFIFKPSVYTYFLDILIKAKRR